MSTLTLDWLQRARAAANADPAFRRLGTCDTRMGLKAGKDIFVVVFVAFECESVAQVDIEALRDVDFYLDLPPDGWNAYLSGRASGTAQSLSSLDTDTPNGLVKARDPLERLAFERYHLTLQSFFDAGARRAA